MIINPYRRRMAAAADGYETFIGSYASADFGDAEETRPNSETALIQISDTSGQLTNAVQNLLRRHTLEIEGRNNEVLLTPVSSSNNATVLRRKLREFFMKQQQSLFNFLEVPVTDIPVASAYHTIQQRFSYNTMQAGNPLRDLNVDLDGASVLKKLNDQLGFQVNDFADHLNQFMKLLADLLDELKVGEDNLNTRLQAIDKLNNNVQSILTLSSKNPVYETLVKTTEEYVREAIKANTLDESYSSLIETHKKLSIMKDAFIGMRAVSSAVSSEPICSVCIAEPVQYTFSSCGHTFCVGCTRKQGVQCFICRTPIRERVKLFFS